MSANNLFQAGVNALTMQPSLDKVVILKQIPRYDPMDVDPLSLKASLSLLFNDTLVKLWMDSDQKHKLFIGSHSIHCSGAIRESRYRHTQSGKFDGIHLYGSSGSKAYTQSVLNICKAAKITSENYNYHQSCPQFQYQNNRRKYNHGQRLRAQNSGNRKQYQEAFTIKTHSRFSPLRSLDQGNWF